MNSNRELYLAIGQLLQETPRQERELETYLISLRGLASAHSSEPRFTLETFFGLLQRALTAPPGGFDEAWRARYGREAVRNSYAAWEQTIIEQIVDLNEMGANGALQDAYFGVTAPRGSHWYNTSVHGFLECATAGAFGGWEPGDSTGRAFVPGQVAYVKPDGTFGSAAAESFERPIVEMATIDWATASDFLRCGQHYE